MADCSILPPMSVAYMDTVSAGRMADCSILPPMSMPYINTVSAGRMADCSILPPMSVAYMDTVSAGGWLIVAYYHPCPCLTWTHHRSDG